MVDLSQAIGNRLNYYKRQRDIIKAHETKAALSRLRKEWLQKQIQTNYQNEYDRIRNILENGKLPGQTRAHLENRQKKLKELGLQALPDRLV